MENKFKANGNSGSKISNLVINLTSEDDPGKEMITEAIKRIKQVCPQLSEYQIRNEVKSIMKIYPHCNSVDMITRYCIDKLVNYISSGDDDDNENQDLSEDDESSSSSSSSSSSVKIINQFIVNPKLQQILEIFPDAKKSYVLQKLSSTSANNSQEIIQLFLEKGYEKEEAPCVNPTTKPIELDFKSKEWETSSSYRQSAILALQNDFPFIRIISLRALFAKHNYHYTLTREEIDACLGEHERLPSSIKSSTATTNKRRKKNVDTITITSDSYQSYESKLLKIGLSIKSQKS